MAMELTDKILRGLKGYLGITVSHPDIAGKLVVKGATANAAEFSWRDMPDTMRVAGRKVYCCEAEWSEDPIFVFADEVTVVDAPAYLVVGALMDELYMINPDTARRLEEGEDGEFDEEE
jgi:hypothetical protein